MRVTRIPGDQYDIGDRPCRVWVNDMEVTDWIVADDFRRCVISPGIDYQVIDEDERKRTPDVVHNGSVRIDMVKGVSIPDGAVVTIAEEAPTSEGLQGLFVKVPEEPVEVPAPSYAAPVVKVTPKPAAKPKRKGRK